VTGGLTTPVDVDATEAWLAGVPGHLQAACAAALPGARAGVLARLWGALAREPIPGIAGRHIGGTDLVVRLADGRWLRAPAAMGQPFAEPEPGFTVNLAGADRNVAGIDHDDPARLMMALALPGATGRLAGELANSVANLALARAARSARTAACEDRSRKPATSRSARTAACEERSRKPATPPRAHPPADDALVHAEQSVVDGHPLHPCCRTRLGMSPAEVLAYAPEHRPVVDLDLVDVPPDRWLSTGDGAPPVLPMHPWQWARLRESYPWLRHSGRRQPARPLMSLRTLATGDGWHLKTALDVQMTSAVRTVSPAAVRNGPAVSALLARLAARTKHFGVLRETAAGAVLVDDEPNRSLAYVRRQAPRLRPDESAAPLATVPVNEDFFGDLVRLLFPPLLTLLHLGVALEAHGQNMLVVLQQGRPVRLLYRDIGGLRLSPRRLRRYGIECPPLAGDMETDEPAALQAKLFAAAVSTVVGQVVARLGGPPQRLWDLAARTARAAYAELPAAAAEDARALFADTIPVKAMTAMRLADEPLDDIWAALPNPLAGSR